VRDGAGEVGTDGALSEEWRGGELGLVEEECVPFVSNRDIEAVACEVLAIGAVDVLIIRAGGRGALEVVDLRDALDAKAWCHMSCLQCLKESYEPDRANLACSASV
jgi:hypothetical protein